MKADLVIRGGTVVDGTGAPPFEADVVVAGDRIAAIGRHDGPAREVIDARGKIVTPGLRRRPHAPRRADHLGSARLAVEPARRHLGGRRQLRRRLRAVQAGGPRLPDVPHGGRRGHPARRHARRAALELGDLPRVPRRARGAAARPQRRRPHQPRAAARLRDGRARRDRRGADRRRARGRCATAVAEAMRAGALGFATGRTTMHRTPAWDPVPGTFADRRELDALAGALAEEGTGVFELVPYGGAGEDVRRRAEGVRVDDAAGARHRRPISLALIQNLAYPDVWREALALAEEAARARRAHRAAGRGAQRRRAARASASPSSRCRCIPPPAICSACRSRGGGRAPARSGAARPTARERQPTTAATSSAAWRRSSTSFRSTGDGVRGYETTPERSVVALARANAASRRWR